MGGEGRGIVMSKTFKYTFWYKKLCVLSAKHAQKKKMYITTIFKLENMNWNKTLLIWNIDLSLLLESQWTGMAFMDGFYVWYFSFEEFDNASAEQHGCIYRSSFNPAENSTGEFLKRRSFYQAVLLSYWEELNTFLMW